MLTEFTDFKRNGTGSIQREIAEFLRRKIVSGKLKPGEKLPSLRKLAELWNTNSFSVNLAMDELTELGFLTKQHGRGVFVTPAKEKIRCIGIYNSCLNSDPRQEVSFQFIQAELCRRRFAADEQLRRNNDQAYFSRSGQRRIYRRFRTRFGRRYCCSLVRGG